jgi:hypothetical protein
MRGRCEVAVVATVEEVVVSAVGVNGVEAEEQGRWWAEGTIKGMGGDLPKTNRQLD